MSAVRLPSKSADTQLETRDTGRSIGDPSATPMAGRKTKAQINRKLCVEEYADTPSDYTRDGRAPIRDALLFRLSCGPSRSVCSPAWRRWPSTALSVSTDCPP